MNKISYFLKIKVTETLGHVYIYTRTRMHGQALHAHASYIPTHTWACMCMLGFWKL